MIFKLLTTYLEFELQTWILSRDNLIYKFELKTEFKYLYIWIYRILSKDIIY